MNRVISKKDAKLLLYAGGILLLVLAYFLGYQKFMEQREVLEAERSSLRQQVNRLDEIYAGKDEYEKQTLAYDGEMTQIFNNYPADVREENLILYASELERKHEIRFTNIGISPAMQIYSLGDSVGAGTAEGTASESTGTAESAAAAESTGTAESADAAGTEADADAAAAEDQEQKLDEQLGILDEASVELPQISLCNMAVAYDFTTGYNDCKSVFAMILESAEKKTVSAISLTYDTETGLLNGNMNVNMYYMTGTDKIYEEPDAGSIVHGKEDLFGTVDQKNEKNDEDSQKKTKKKKSK